MKTTILPLKNSMNRSRLQAFLLNVLVLAFAWLALSPAARAACEEGCRINAGTFLGEHALINDTGFGYANTAMGLDALRQSTSGADNTAVGAYALPSNTSGGENTATGAFALQFNTRGGSNTATGAGALAENTTGNFNTATGDGALEGNNTGDSNTANGVDALRHNTVGSNNTAIGFRALGAIGGGENNIAIGRDAGATLRTKERNNIEIGNIGVTGEADTIRIGTTGTQTNTYIAGISGATVPTGVAVIVDSSGHLGTTTSSARFKEAVKPMGKTSEAILALKPVTFRYKPELDPKGIQQFGLVAEQVEKVNPDLVARDDQGKPYTVRYEAVNAMLLNEFLKARRQIDAQQKQIEALTAGLQKVSAQLEASKPLLQTIANNQ